MKAENKRLIGLGEVIEGDQINVSVYIANRPPLEPYQYLDHLNPMVKDEIYNIGQLTGNHWRKVFNVYAKLMFEFAQTAHKELPNWVQSQLGINAVLTYHTWQAYRDGSLLQSCSQTSLLFNQPDTNQQNALHIIMGKQYASELGFPCTEPNLIDHEHMDFAYYPDQSVIVCPYFDYRQLSNIKITALVNIMMQWVKANG